MNRNTSQATPDRNHASGFLTPVNPNPPSWSPILHATTPDLNLLGSDCKGTPALKRSLGINPDLDISWSSAMATPIANTASATKESMGLEISEDFEDKVQRRNLFFHNSNYNQSVTLPRLNPEENTSSVSGLIHCEMSDDVNKSIKEPLCNTEMKSSHNTLVRNSLSNYENQRKENYEKLNVETLPTKTDRPISFNDLLSLLKKPSKSFVYPEPVSIELNSNIQTLNIKIRNHIKQEVPEENAQIVIEEESVLKHSEMQRFRSSSKEVRKSLNFAESTRIEHTKDMLNKEEENSQIRGLAPQRPQSLGIASKNIKQEVSTAEFNFPEKVYMEQEAEMTSAITLSESGQEDAASRLQFESVGFSTASGKGVTISEKSIARAKAMFEENDDVATSSRTDLLPMKPSNRNEKQTQADYSNCKPVDFAQSETTKSIGYDPPISRAAYYSSTAMSPKAIGFSTASGKNLVISEKALAQAKSLFSELDDNIVLDSPVAKVDGFSTASGKKIKVSNEALIRAETLLKDEKEGACVEQEVKLSSGTPKNFSVPKSSLGKQVNSEMSRIGANAPFQTERVKRSSFSEFPTATGINSFNSKNVPISKKVLPTDEATFGAETTNSDLTSIQIPKNVGFNTASGKSVTISKSALSKAQKLFEENFSSEDSSETIEKFPMRIEPSSARAVILQGKNVCCSSSVPMNVGFNTASGKNVAISTAALSKAQKIFEEQFLNDVLSEADGKLPVGTKPSSSKVANLLGNLEPIRKNNIPSSSTVPVNVGFNTASGKNVAISTAALSKAQKVFEEQFYNDDLSETVEKLPVGTKPSSAKVANLQGNSEPIRKNNILSSSTIPVNVGFNTASGKNVAISTAALSKAQKVFEECINEDFSKPVETLPTINNPSCSSNNLLQVKDETVEKKRKLEDDEIKDDADWVSSPTIGKKKRKKPTPSPRTQLTQTPVSGTPSAFENAPTSVTAKVLAFRRQARQAQKLLIKSKQTKTIKTSPKPGFLYQRKKDETRLKKSWKDLISKSSLPEMCAPYQLLQDYGMLPSVCLVNASNASTFNFYAWEYFPVDECRGNSNGLQLGEFLVILSDDNTIGCEEIGDSLLASEHVEPTLINSEWIRNHYRWIIWKLASMEIRLPNLFARSCLTPRNVLEQLKYRYDREIDRCERSALRRIIEQDDTAAKTMILCVAGIRSPTILEVTDGWYSIDAHCDNALQQLITKNKIFVGVKLAISGAELASPGPSAPLEKGSDTFLKISGNSTRRARWDTKLGFHVKPMPISITLPSVLAEGGVVSCVQITIIRVYPIIYMEKSADGKTLFHSERQYRRISENVAMRYERMMEKIVEDIEREDEEQERKRTRAEGNRNSSIEDRRFRIQSEAQKRMQANMKTMEGTPMLKLRVVGWQSTESSSAIVSIWRPREELQDHLREGRAFRLLNVNAAGHRFGELQLNALKNTSWIEIKNYSPPPNIRDLQRNVTPFSKINSPGFKPIFNELDTVGLVVYVEQQETKGPFQTAVLSDGVDHFGIKCWGSLEDYSLNDVIVVGAFLAFSNLQWRATASRTNAKLQFAFINESTIVSSRPALKHLEIALQELKQSISDPSVCISEAELQVVAILGNTTPQSGTPRFGKDVRRSGAFTPTGVYSVDVKKDDTPSTSASVTRSRLLEKYGAPPSLSPSFANASPHVRQKFKPPARKPPAV